MPAVTAKGQTTIPKDIRNHLGVKPGDRVDFVVEADGGVRVIAKTLHAADLAGFLRRPKSPATVEEMNKAIVDGAVGRFRRAVRATKSRRKRSRA